ncbi:MAG TPA: DUF2637 domain-containing protein [Micromonosporaceae bacterium]|nr:DUF2637 domain-containing protein [Micromonosporaceae bacterium]
MRLPQLRRVRWAVRATLSLGVAASVTANVLHAQDNPISQAIAAWPPLALLLTVELISRVPVHRRSLTFTRLAATATIAGIAAWVSYWHMAGVASRYGETGASPYLLPLSVDGLIIVASISLVELAGRIRETEDELEAKAPAAGSTPGTAATGHLAQMPTRLIGPTNSTNGAGPSHSPAGNGHGGNVYRGGAGADGGHAANGGMPLTGTPLTRTTPAGTARRATGSAKVRGSAGPAAPGPDGARVTPSAAALAATAEAGINGAAGPRQRRPVAETAALAAAIEAAHPEITDAEVAQQLGISTTRLKAIKRETRQLEPVPA